MLETQLQLGLKDQGRLLSNEEFANAHFDEPYRYERMGGRLIVMSPSDLEHSRMISIILKQLFRYDSQNDQIIDLIVPEGWLRTGNGQDRMADIAVYLTQSATSANHIYDLVPDLIIEVISQGSEERDYIIKRKEYFDVGVTEYIIIDPFRKVITALTRGSNDYIDQEIQNGNRYQSTVLPNFALQTNTLPW